MSLHWDLTFNWILPSNLSWASRRSHMSQSTPNSRPFVLLLAPKTKCGSATRLAVLLLKLSPRYWTEPRLCLLVLFAEKPGITIVPCKPPQTVWWHATQSFKLQFLHNIHDFNNDFTLFQSHRTPIPYTPLCLAKAVKNPTEIQGMRMAHVRSIWYSCPKEWLSHQLPGPGFSKMSNSWMNSFTFNQFVCLIQMDSAIISSPLFHPANIFTTFSSLPQRTFRQLSCTSTSHLVCSVCSLPFVCSASGNHSGR